MFYIYEHWRPDKNECFYVGKGKRYGDKPYRAYQMSKGRNRHHKAIVAKLKIRDLCVDVRFIFETDNEEEAYSKEIERIAYWRATGVNLTNLADGGGRNSGWKQSQERRKRNSELKRGNTYRLGAVLSEETKQKIARAHTGKKLTISHIEAMSIAASGERNGFFGKKHTAETGAKVASANKSRIWSDESRAKLSASLKRRPPRQKGVVTWTHSEETRENYRIAALKRWQKKREQNATCII